MRKAPFVVTAALAGTIAFLACGDDPSGQPGVKIGEPTNDGGTTDGGETGFPFEAVGPSTYVPKVKNLLTGLPATDAEVAAVTADPNALKGLIDQWMTLPSFQVRMLDFFRNAFQQNQVTLAALQASVDTNFNVNPQFTPRLVRNLMDSFGLTVWKLLEEGRPFTESFTTRRYMMTTAMASLMSFVDDWYSDDANRDQNRLTNEIPSFVMDATSNLTSDQSLTPGANFMRFKFTGTPPATCAGGQNPNVETVTRGANPRPFYNQLFSLLMGRANYDPCQTNPPNQNVEPQFKDEDWSDWHLVEIKVNKNRKNAAPSFWEVPKLRTATELTLTTDRLGFFGTLAFDANWATNPANEARVTANQALIVAIGQSIAGEDLILQFPLDSSDADHIENPACKGCHLQLDPYKNFFRQSYTLNYHEQEDAGVIASTANFGISGVNQGGKGVSDLANIFAAHPRLPLAWAQKLHFWASSTAALEDDPELVRVADAFKGASFDFKTLVRELFSSPLLTWASATKTTQTNGVIVSIARRDQFCASLSNRLGLPDVCGMQSSKRLTAQQNQLAQRALLLPADGYNRAFALPSLPTNPDLFFRQATEAICTLVAEQLVDVAAPGTSKYTSANAGPALDDFVATVMGLPPGDPRSAKARVILDENFEQAKGGGGTPTQALKSTFILACLSPSSVIVGL